ncbi:hypothetical protein [Halarchaeum salinum]|uniref:Ig-like domain repeat protein n=1 Tax=Halarchaeum salinum TaxID=489912 RepID=A0AAV3S8G8_9EURY
MTPNKHQLGVVIAALLLLPSGAAAYSASFDGGAGTSYETGSGLVVTSGIDHGLDGTNPFNGSDTVYLDGVSISASGPASVTVDQFRGTRTQLSGIDATSTAITVDPDDKSAVEISGGITDLSWEDAALDNSNQITFSADSAGTITATDLPNETDWTAATPDGVLVDSGTTTASGEAQISVDAATDEELILFTNQPPSVTNATPTGTIHTNSPELSVDVDDATFGTAQGESVSLEWFVDGSSVGTTSVSSAGTATFEPSISDGNHTWHVVATDSYGTTTTLGDQSISVEHFAPTIESASPVDGASLTQRETTFTVDVSDQDFAFDGDTVTGTLHVDNATAGSSTVSSNGTIEITHTMTGGGSHSYHWEISDTYGYSTSTSTRTVWVPSSVTIRSEIGEHKIIDNTSLNVSARLYSGELIFQRNVTGGKVDLSGVSVDREYVLAVRADGYYQRTIVISNIYNQSTIYLLPTDAQAVLDVFQLNDRTGKYPTESSTLVIKRAINTTDGGLQWQRIAGDYFGAAGQFKAHLQQDRRYRLVLSNSQGDTRVLGHYSTDISETVVLNPVPVGVDVDSSATTYAWEATRSNGTIAFEFTDPANATTDLHVSIHEEGNQSNVLLNQTYQNGPYGTVSVTQPLVENQTNASWVVSWRAERHDEIIRGTATTATPRQDLVPGLAPWIKHALSIIMVVIVAALFTQLNAAVGGVTTALVGGGFWLGGWLPPAAGGAIAIALMLAVVVKAARARGA